MAKVINRRRYSLGLQILLVICISFIFAVEGQDGFLSIDCGNDVSYNDTNGIFWETDGIYTATGKNVKNITVGTVKFNGRQSETARVFSDAKSCYVLPVTSGETYLVRLSFFDDGSLTTIDSSVTFDWYLDNNLIQTYSIAPGVRNVGPNSPLTIDKILDRGFDSCIEAF